MSSKPKLIVLFTSSHADTLGNANRLAIVAYLIKYFNVTLVTNQAKFLQTQFKDCSIVDIKLSKLNIPVISQIHNWFTLGQLINNINGELCFMICDTSPVSNFINIPVFQYVHQFGTRSNKKSNILKRILQTTYQFIIDWFYFSGLKKSKAVFVVSKPIIALLEGKGVSNLVHIPHGVDIEKFSKPNITEFHNQLRDLKDKNSFIITYTGWVSDNRGFQLMLDIILNLSKSTDNIVLVIAGANEEFSSRIKEFQISHNLQNNIINYGIIDVNLVPGILYYSDICLSFLDDVPAHRISPPQKVIEYFAAGKPVISNKIAPHEWLIEDGKTGYILEQDADLISNKILGLMNNKELLREMSNNAYNESLKYDIDTIYGKMVSVMNEYIEEKKVK